MSFVKNKKGFLLAEETLKILIAVIALIFLVYLLTSIYFAKVKGDKLNQAESWLISSDESLKVLTNNLTEGETKIKDIIEPDGWYLFSFSGDSLKPNSCADVNCVCFCDNVLWEGLNKDRQQEECSDNGICLIDNRFGEFPKIKITGELQLLKIINQGGSVYIVE